MRPGASRAAKRKTCLVVLPQKQAHNTPVQVEAEGERSRVFFVWRFCVSARLLFLLFVLSYPQPCFVPVKCARGSVQAAPSRGQVRQLALFADSPTVVNSCFLGLSCTLPQKVQLLDVFPLLRSIHGKEESKGPFSLFTPELLDVRQKWGNLSRDPRNIFAGIFPLGLVCECTVKMLELGHKRGKKWGPKAGFVS